jgi:hypothetical protein
LLHADADPDRLNRVLAAIGQDIGELGEEEGGPSWVSDPIPTPEGPMILLDMSDVPLDELRPGTGLPLRARDQAVRAASSTVIFTRLCARTPCLVQIRVPSMPSRRVRSHP